jgi:hypothetical protein
MTAPSEVDLTTLRRDIHGAPLRAHHQCDYCGGPLDTRRAVLYDAIRAVDVPALSHLTASPPRWIPDAARCPDCECDSIRPATAGYDELLVWLSLTHRNDVARIDTSSATVVAYAPPTEGTPPPMIDTELIVRFTDFGLPRWIRIQRLLEYTGTGTGTALERIREIVADTPEVPPEIR